MGIVALVVLLAAGLFLWVRRDGPAPVASPGTPAPVTRSTPRPRPSTPPIARTTPAPRVEGPSAGPRLRIDSDVPGASVFLDRRYVGTTPVEIETLEPGSHRLNLSADGYEMQARDIDAETAPRDLVFRFKEIDLDQQVSVVHKHGIGSCRGTLSASAEGIRYATDNRDHAFSAPLAAIEKIEVDYLDENLKVRIKGKTYNFTHPEGKADPLFVFQREVEKARTRLREG